MKGRGNLMFIYCDQIIRISGTQHLYVYFLPNQQVEAGLELKITREGETALQDVNHVYKLCNISDRYTIARDNLAL